MKPESTVYFLQAFWIICIVNFILLLYKIFIRSRIAIGISSLIIWFVLSLGMLFLHILNGIGVAHSPPDYFVETKVILNLIGIHLSYLLIGFLLIYWVGRKKSVLH
jgi:uncharacterized membrane protein